VGCPTSVPHEAVMRFARSSGPSLREDAAYTYSGIPSGQVHCRPRRLAQSQRRILHALDRSNVGCTSLTPGGLREVIKVVVRQLRRFHDLNIDIGCAKGVDDVADPFGPDTRLLTVRQHERRRRSPAMIDLADPVMLMLMDVAAGDESEMGSPQRVPEPPATIGRHITMIDLGFLRMLVEERLMHEEREGSRSGLCRDRGEERPLLVLCRQAAPQQLRIHAD
jgi:hypothetical protein